MNFFKLLILSVLIPCFTFAGSPIIFGPTGPTSLANGGVMFPDGSLVKDGGGSNKIRNSTAENGLTTGYTLSKNTSAAATPDSGFVTTSLSNTFAVSATTPIEGAKSFLWTLAALGEQVCYPFTIDNGSQGDIVRGSLDYAIASGTFADDAATVWIYYAHTTTPEWIQPSGYLFKNHTLKKQTRSFEFQARAGASAENNYKLCLHQAAASTAALRIDNVQVGPQVARGYGSNITDWVSYTPTFTGAGTVSIDEAQWLRVGDSMYVRVRVTTGTTSAVTASMTLPNGLTTNVTSQMKVGDCVAQTSNPLYSTSVLAPVGSNTLNFGVQGAGLGSGLGNAVWGSSSLLSITAGPIKITGWSSGSQIISTDSPNGVVAMKVVAGIAPTGPFNGSAAIVFPSTPQFDTVGGYSTSTGKYTVKTPGKYRVNFTLRWNGTAVASDWAAPYVYKNTTSQAYKLQPLSVTSSTLLSAGVTTTVDCVAGDTLEVRLDTSATGNAHAIYDIGSVFEVEMLQGPSQILASADVSASYQLAGAVSISTTQPVNYATKIYDSHGAVTTGASWKFTAPISGLYNVSTALAMGTSTCTLYVYKGGSAGPILGTTTTASFGGGSQDVRLLAGEYIDIRSDAGAQNTNSSTSQTISIKRVGQY